MRLIEDNLLPLEGLCLKSICSGVLCASDDLPLSPFCSTKNLTFFNAGVIYFNLTVGRMADDKIDLFALYDTSIVK